MMMGYFETQCDIIDASVVNGDVLADEYAREEFREYLTRWDKAIQEWEAHVAEEEA